MGVDSSESGIDIATGAHADIPFRRLDATLPLAADLRGRFDAVVAIEVLDHTPLPREMLRQAIAALRPGGLLVATVPFHGYVKNLGLALSARFDERWHALHDHGRVKFYSRRTLTAKCSPVSVNLKSRSIRLPAAFGPFSRTARKSKNIAGVIAAAMSGAKPRRVGRCGTPWRTSWAPVR